MGLDVIGVAIAIVVDLSESTTNETVKVEYAVDFSTDYVTLETISDTNGITEFALPDKIEPRGVAFIAIRFRLTLARGGTITLTPHVNALTLKFLKKLPERWNHSMTLDMHEEIGGFAPRDMGENLRTSINKNELLEFSYKDGEAANDSSRHWVRVAIREGDEGTGLDYGGEAILLVSEPQHLNT